MKDAEPFVLAQAVKQLRNRLGVGHGVFQLTDAIGHVGVGVGHAAEADVVHAGVVGDANFLDDVLRRPPNRDAFFRFDAEFAPSFVAYAALVDLHFVGQRPGLVLAAEVGVVAHRFACSTRLRPCRPLFCCPALVFPFPLFEEVVQGGVRVLNGEEKIGPKRRPALLFPASDGPTPEQGRRAMGQASDEVLGFLERNGGAAQVFPRDDRTGNAHDAKAILQALGNGFGIGLERLTIAIYGEIVVIKTGRFQHATDVPNMESDVGRDAKGSRLVFVSVQHQPAWLGRFNHGSRGRGAAFNPSSGGGVACASCRLHPLLEGLGVLGRIFHHHHRLGHRLGFHRDRRPCRLWPWRCRP